MNCVESGLILIALGSNRRHHRHGRPDGVVRAATAALAAAGLTIMARSSIHVTAPVGPGGRRFANAAIAVQTAMPLVDLLRLLKSIERGFGRRPGRRWGDRVLDLDIIGAEAAVLRRPGLTVPHPGIAHRRFVLDPLVEIAASWRHPLLHATVRQLRARAMRPMARVHAG